MIVTISCIQNSLAFIIIYK